MLVLSNAIVKKGADEVVVIDSRMTETESTAFEI